MIKDLIVVGTRVETINHQTGISIGVREVCSTTSSMFALKDMGGGIKWCRFPAASQYEIDGDTITIWQGTEKLLSYKIS
jgi:hypothetical protein